MKILDLFAGTGAWSWPWRVAGHDVITLDHNPVFAADVQEDFRMWSPADLPWRPDVVLASPPCEGFSVASIGRSWYSPGHPKSETARKGMQLLYKTLSDLWEMQPRYWILENPRGMMRKLAVMQPLERRTVTYCTLGETRMKPTDLWGGFPSSLELPRPCKVDREAPTVTEGGRDFRVNLRTGKPCHEVQLSGRQKKQPAHIRARVPRQLAEKVMAACITNDI